MLRSVVIWCVTIGASCAVSSVLAQQQSPPLHVLKIAAGPAGVEENGTFRFTEERSSFSRTDHREVIVMFQWDGTPGRHFLEANWRSPDGAYSSKSTIDYTAKDRRFGAYWRFTIAPTMQLGMWSIEATVDGQPGGRFTFEITDARAAPAPPLKRPLTQQELYDRIAKSFVLLTRSGPGARGLDSGGGVVAESGQLLTAISLLDNVERVTATLNANVSHDVDSVIDMNRSVGWAIVAARTENVPVLPRAAERPRIGDRCYSMHGSATGARVLLEGQVAGISSDPSPVSGWIVAFANGAGVAGAPVLNEFGELLGILGRSAAPDARRLQAAAGATVEFGNTPLIPIAVIAPRTGATPAALDALRKRGDLMQPLVGDDHVLSGGFAAKITTGPVVALDSQRTDFSAQEKEFAVFVTWSPRARLKGQTQFHLFDASNRLIVSTKPAKINFRANDLVMSSLKVPMLKEPGVYRAEIHLDGKPAWRDYLRITP